MKHILVHSVLGIASVCVASAADTPESICSALDAGLSKQQEILAGVQDAASAQASIGALQDNFRYLTALNERVDTNDLWRHIENSPELKTRLIGYLQQITIHLMRIETAEFYGCAELRSLLEPMLTPASSRGDEEQPE
jgi:hypothetical protein